MFRETQGLLLYQEQVMLLLHGLGGIPLDAATGYLLERSPCFLVSWMDKQRVNIEERDMFVAGCEKVGMPRDTADRLWQATITGGPFILKAHMVGLALVACWRALVDDGKGTKESMLRDIAEKTGCEEV